MEQIFYNALTLFIMAYGFAIILYGVGIIKTSPGRLLGRMIRGVLKGTFWLLAALFEASVDFSRALIQGAPAGRTVRSSTQAQTPFLEGRERRRLISRWKDGLTIDGKRQISRDDSYRHLLLVSPTGGGKTSGYCIPTILKTTGASLIVTDPGGTLFQRTSGWMESQGFSIRVLNFTDQANSERYNPLALAHTHTEIDMVSHLLVETSFPNAGGEQSFWSQGAMEIISVLLKCLKNEPEVYHNLANLRFLLNRFETYGRPLYHFVDRNADEQVFHQFRSFISQDLKVLQGMLSTAKAALSKFSDPELCLLTSESTFDVSELREHPTVVYLIVREDQVSYYAFILTLFYSQLFSMCMQLSEDDTSALPIYCILEEAGNMGALPNFQTVITTLRRRRTSCSLICQDLGQLEDLYGRAGAKVIVNSCASRLFLPGLPHETCKRIEEMLGKQEDEKGRLQSVMTASQIRTLPDGKAIFMYANKKPALIDIKPYYRNWKLRRRTTMPPAALPHPVRTEVTYLDLAPTASSKSEQPPSPVRGDTERRKDRSRGQSADAPRDSTSGVTQQRAAPSATASSGTSDDAEKAQAPSKKSPVSDNVAPASEPPSSLGGTDEKAATETGTDKTMSADHQTSDDHVPETKDTESAPPWADQILEESQRARQEVEELREKLGAHDEARKEAAISGKAGKTPQNAESEVVVLTPEQVRSLVKQAAQQGASESLRKVVGDLGQLREILETQRGVLSKAQCMNLMGITSNTTYYKRCEEGLPFYTIGKQRFHFLEEVMDWMRTSSDEDTSERKTS